MKNDFKKLKAQLAKLNPAAILWDGFEEALVGIREREGKPAVAVYGYEKMVTILMQRDDMRREDAIEYIEFNVTDGWLGDSTPITLDEEVAREIDNIHPENN